MHNILKNWIEGMKEKYNKIPTTPENVARMQLLAEMSFDLPSLLSRIEQELGGRVGVLKLRSDFIFTDEIEKAVVSIIHTYCNKD